MLVAGYTTVCVSVGSGGDWCFLFESPSLRLFVFLVLLFSSSAHPVCHADRRMDGDGWTDSAGLERRAVASLLSKNAVCFVSVVNSLTLLSVCSCLQSPILERG